MYLYKYATKRRNITNKKNNEFIQSNYNDGIHQLIEILNDQEYFGLSNDDNSLQKYVDQLVKFILEKIHLKELEDDGIVKELELDGIVKELNKLEGQIKTDKVDELTNRVEYLLKDFIRKKTS